MKTAFSFFRLPNLLLIVGLSFAFRQGLLSPIYVQFAISHTLSPALFWWLVSDILLVALIGFWINDWFDRKIDAINKPNRFLANRDEWPKRLTVGLGLALSLCISITLFVAIQTNRFIELFILPAALTILYVYARKWKKNKFVGNFLVSLMVVSILGMLLLAEWNSIQLIPSLERTEFLIFLIIISVLLFFTNMCREIAKDAQDYHGDISNSVTSIPIVFGIKNTAKTLTICNLLILIALSILCTVFVETTPQLALLLLAVALVGGITYTLWRSNKNWPVKASSLYKLLMLVGILLLSFISPM